MEEPKPATNPDVHQQGTPEKTSKRSKFFAFLGCCGTSGVDSEDTVPAKKTVRQTGPTTQPTPEKVHTGDSHTVEPTEPSYVGEEKPNLTVTADQSQSSEAHRNPNHTGQEQQVDGTPVAAGQPQLNHDNSSQKDHIDHVEAGDTDRTKNAPEVAEKMDNAVPPEHVDMPTATQVTEDPGALHDYPPEKPPLAGDNDKDETAYQVGEEEAAKVPAELPPPPPLTPGKPVSSAPSEGAHMLLPPPLPHLRGRKCLVLDLDETLVHSSFKVPRIPNCRGRALADMIQVLERADFTIPVEIEGQYHNIYVIKRPGVDQFMKRVGELYEVVIFTASVSKV